MGSPTCCAPRGREAQRIVIEESSVHTADGGARRLGEPILSVRDLHTYFASEGGVVRAVDGVSFELHAGETFGIVGESGSGKSVTCRSLIGLLPAPPAYTTGAVEYDG